MSATAKKHRLLKLLRLIQGLQIARASLLAFTLVYLGHLLSDPCGAFHERLCAELEQAVRPGGRVAGALPREHGKTTLGTVALVLRELCLGTGADGAGKRNILIVAANRSEARSKLRLIAHELETNPRLHAAFGARLRPARDAWGRNVAYGDFEMVLAGGARVAAFTFGGKVRGQLHDGRRPDLVILDDPEDDATVRSEISRRRQREWVERALLNALDVDRGSLVWLGSLIHHDAALANLLKKIDGGGLAGWRALNWPALDDGGRPLWPERWSAERLAQRRAEIGEQAFAQEYLNQPVSLSLQLFLPQDFHLFDHAQLKRESGEWVLEGRRLTLAIGVDPALGERVEHDWFAAVVLGLTRQDQPSGSSWPLGYILHVLRVKAAFPEQLRLLTDLCRGWLPRAIGIEAVAYQAALAQAAWELGLPAIPLKAGKSKLARIEAVALHAQAGRLFLPATGEWVAAFREEASAYPAGRHDDQLDALARAYEAGLPLIAGARDVHPAPAKRDPVSGY